MSESRGAARRPSPPVPRRSRRRWAIAGGVLAAWLGLKVVAGSYLSATVLLVVFAVLGGIVVLFLRSMGITRDHPRIRQLASRPWRDGQEVLRVASRHISDVFVITPSGSLLAPNSVELQMNQDDLAGLCEHMDLGVVCMSMTEVYEEAIAESGARLPVPERADVYVISDESVPRGRYRLRQGHPARAASAVQYPVPDEPGAQYLEAPYLEAPYPEAAPQYAPQYAAGYAEGDAGQDRAWREPAPSPTMSDNPMLTVKEQVYVPVPRLRLITGDSVAETRSSGARAGRGCVELALPDVPTVSREHARFTFADGRWWVTNLGLNGLMLNGDLVTGERPLSGGDVIRWGSRPDSPESRIEIS